MSRSWGSLLGCVYREDHGASVRINGPKAHPSEPDYDNAIREAYGGPPPKYFYQCFQEWPAKYPESAGRVALVTGAEFGVGFYIAKILARLGFEVIIPALDLQRCGKVADAITDAVPGAKVTMPPIKMDLMSLKSVRDFAAEVTRGWSCLDVLCLNAGRGGAANEVKRVSEDGMEAIMQVNAFGNFVLCAELMPLLLKSSGARIISQSSPARFSAKPQLVEDFNAERNFVGSDQYCLSKAANVLFTRALNDRLEKAGVDNVIACFTDPGFACTGVNFQHDMAFSFLGCFEGCCSTRVLHNKVGHHAADGALTQALAAVDPACKRNSWYTPSSGVGPIPSGPPFLADPAKSHGTNEPKKDAGNSAGQWRSDSPELFWAQAVRLTGADLRL